MRRELFLVIFMSAVTQFGALEGLAPQPVLTLQAGWPEIFVGESVTLRCEIARQAGGWRYSWYRDGIPVRETYSDRLDGANYTIRDASRYHSGDYTCRVDSSSSPAHQSLCSDPVKILVSIGLVILQAPLMPLTRGEGVTLQCRVRGNPSLSQVLFYKDDKVIAAQASPVLTMARLTEGDEGNYWCRSTWGRQWRWRSARSLEVPLSVTVMSAVTQFGALEGLAPQPVLTLQAGWPEIFVGESVTLRCEIARQAGGWRYSWYRDGIPVRETYSDRLDGANYTIRDASRYHSGDYTCRVDRSSSPARQSLCSDPVKILVSTGLVILQAPLMPLTRGEGVTLQCRVRGNPSLSQVLFYKDDKVIAAQASPVLTMARLTEGDEGSYWCRATWGRQWRWRSARSLEVPLSVTDPVEEDYESGYRPGPTDFSTAHSIHTDHSLPDSPSLSHPSLPDTSIHTDHSLPDSPSLSHHSLPDTSNPTAHSLPDSPSLSHPSLPDTSNPTAHSLPDSPSLSHPSLPDTSNPTARSLPNSPSLSHPSLPDTSNPTAHSLPDSPSLSHPSLPDTSNPTAHSLPDSPSLSHPSLPDTSNPTARSLPDSPSLSHPSLPDTSNPTAHSLPDSPSLSHPSLPDTSNPTAHSLPDSPSLSHPSLPDTSIHTDYSLPDSPSFSHPSLPDTSIHTDHSLPDSPSLSHPSLPDTSIHTDHSISVTADPITSNHSHLSLLNTVSPSDQPLSDTPHPTAPVQTELDTDWSSQMTSDSTV
ncbi:uncharacterized protein LOC117430278 isoform X2 [Acipenser ruthenus]|uniref:uncharacterized protein LOC117430278 isoform X2 n=1 Tax=Acipenser ruthenus TaxID=7906 RepID=UPI00274286F2|nr:uncharacterized protein LOC117430278 isoform X2 [Acipenser ruthenus]